MKQILDVWKRAVIVAFMTAIFMTMIQSCTTSSYLKSVSVSGDILVAVGQSYLDTGATYDQLCSKKVISVSDCSRWEKAAKTFQPAYEGAAKAWNTAANEKDARAAAVAIVTLSTQLTEYALRAASAAGGVK